MNILSRRYLGLVGLVLGSASSLVAQQAHLDRFSGQPQAATAFDRAGAAVEVVPSENATESTLGRLFGRYTFYATGTQPGVIGFPKVAMMGSFAADGKGHITGIEDYNSSIQSFNFTGEHILGTYTLNRNGVGTLNINSSDFQQTFTIDMSTVAGRAHVGVLQETDGFAGTVGSISQQELPISIAGVYRVSASGENVQVDPNNFEAQISENVGVSGTLTFTRGIGQGPFSISFGFQGGAEDTSATDISAVTTKPDDNGRFLMNWTLPASTGISDTSHFVCYVVNDNEFRIFSIDPQDFAIFPLTTGAAVR